MKRQLAWLLVLLLMVALPLTGCTKPTAGAETAGVTATKGADTGPVEEGGFPIVKEPTKLKIFYGYWSERLHPDQMPMWPEFEALTGIDIEWEVPTEGVTEKKNLLLSSGDLPDVFFCTLSSVDFAMYSDSFVILDEYIEKYGTNIKKMFEEEPLTKMFATQHDGHIYSLPSVFALRPDTVDCLWMNNTWLTKLNLKVPTTTEEFADVLKAFVQNDPNGNGKPDEIGYTTVNWGLDGMCGIGDLFGSFGVMIGDRMSMVKDGKVLFAPAMEEYRKGVKWFEQLYADGLLDKDFFTQTDYAVFAAKARDPEIMRVGSGTSYTIMDGVGADYMDDYIDIPPPKGPDGYQYWRHCTWTRFGKNQYTITKDCKIPEIAFKFANACYDEERSLQLVYGSIGVTINRINEGTYQYEFVPTPEGLTDGEFKHRNGFDTNGPAYTGREFEKKVKPGPNEAFVKLLSQEVYEPYFWLDSLYPDFNFAPDDTDELSTIVADLRKYVHENLATWVMEGGIDDDWDNYLKQLDTMGLKRYQEILQKYYDNSVGGN